MLSKTPDMYYIILSYDVVIAHLLNKEILEGRDYI